MLKEGVIEPAMSEWASPVVFAPKKDEKLRFCVDYRKVNAMTVRDTYPLPRMDECIDSLGGATIFSTVDCNNGYWQTEIPEADRNKTTFSSHHGLFLFIRMPFELKNAPASFQRAVDIIMSRVKRQSALVYLDDIIVYSKSVTKHLVHVRTMLTLLRNAGVALNLSKCFFLTIRRHTWGTRCDRENWEWMKNTARQSASLYPRRTKRNFGPFYACAACTAAPSLTLPKLQPS